MTKMAELQMEIEDMLDNGYDAEDISLILNIPIDWIYNSTKYTENDACQDYYDQL